MAWLARMTNVPSSQAFSALSGQATNELRDIKPPVEISSGWALLLWLAAILLLAGVATFLFWLWMRQKASLPHKPAVPPHVRARQRLEAALRLISEPREFCIAVSDALRWYLEERFHFRAPERTTEEFMGELNATNLLDPQQKQSLADFLNRCDLVKFAKFEPAEPELRDLHASALRLVDQTAPVEVMPAPGASQLPRAQVNRPRTSA